MLNINVASNACVSARIQVRLLFSYVRNGIAEN